MADPVRLVLSLEEPPPAAGAGEAGVAGVAGAAGAAGPRQAGKPEEVGWLSEAPVGEEGAPADGPSISEESPHAATVHLLTLEAGQEVRGVVEVEALEEVEFRELQVRFFWHTEGKGNLATGESSTQALARFGHWMPGGRHRFPFRISAPWGPLSYKGRILSVAWDLEARLDRSILRGEVVEKVPVNLEGSPDPEHASLGPMPQEKHRLEAAKRGLKKVWVASGVLLLVLGILFGAANNWELSTAGKWLLFLLMSVGFLFTSKGMWGRLGRGKLGEPSVHLSTTELRRGEEIRFSVAIRPEQRTELRSLEVVLECEERVVEGHGQYQIHHRRTVIERRLVLAEDHVIDPHRGLRKKGTVTVPLNAPPSFGAPHNQIVWWLRFRGDIVGWPDWNEPILLTVWP